MNGDNILTEPKWYLEYKIQLTASSVVPAGESASAPSKPFFPGIVPIVEDVVKMAKASGRNILLVDSEGRTLCHINKDTIPAEAVHECHALMKDLADELINSLNFKASFR